MDIKKAIEHYNYGISHDIFSEPVTSYARLAVDALEKQVPKKPKDDGWLYCPVCGRDVLMDRFKYCPDCGQRIDWESVENQ